MPFIARQEPFTCERCSNDVQPLEKGSYRNHCPSCLWSKHVDKLGPGDRASSCGGMMKPIAIDQTSKKGFLIVHKCQTCGKQVNNKAAPDDALTEFLRSEASGEGV